MFFNKLSIENYFFQLSTENFNIGSKKEKLFKRCILILDAIANKVRGVMEEFLTTIFKDKQLDDNQKKAVLSEAKRLIIIAGAGSGKTTTLAAKVKYLVQYKGVNPNEILLISFTNKAVFELNQIINVEFKLNVAVKTFHKLGLEILKKANTNYHDYKILNNKEVVINEIIRKYNISSLSKKLYQYVDAPYLVKKIKLLEWYKQKHPDLLSNLTKYLTVKETKISENEEGLAFLKFYQEVTDEYKKYKEENKMIDFDDMINKACEVVNETKLNYNYIIVDEYQDISRERYLLLKAVSENKNLIVVGDDWQSIFKFASSDVELFHDFMTLNDVEIVKITNTYRNSQELIDIAGEFVMKDNKHVKKALKSSKRLKDPIRLIKYRKMDSCLEKILRKFSKNEKILILGRFSFDIYKLLGKKFYYKEGKIVSVLNPELDIDFLTIHAAKGLGYDQVIIINVEKGEYGFPSLKKDANFIKKENNDKEERRLLYVAITRTKNYTYILYKKNNHSYFIPELKKIIESRK
jgi:superfamily I DNA/RNA helicase